MSRSTQSYDLLGIGFGPSNLALAISIAETTERPGAQFSQLFLECQADFAWHPDMLLPGSDMQISFLKDLVSLRDPTSPYTFINYLHAHGRLARFANRKTFFPSRAEFDDYLRWVARHFDNVCAYGERVVRVDPVQERQTVTMLQVTSETGDGTRKTRYARNLAVASGGQPAIPKVFSDVARDDRVIHSADYLSAIGRLEESRGRPRRVAVIGSGQSAAEIFLDLHQRFPGSRNDLIFRSHGLSPSDDSPFVNEIFDPEFTDALYARPRAERIRFLDVFRGTNYGVVDLDLIERIYTVLYEQEVAGVSPHHVLPLSQIVQASRADAGVFLTRQGVIHGAQERTSYDAIILATGYSRDDLSGVLSGVRDWIAGEEADRYYRLPCRVGFQPTIFQQGGNEVTHGLSDTLLSVLPQRSREIRDALLAELPVEASGESAA
jgi:L-ornithine N5-oxygenase